MCLWDTDDQKDNKPMVVSVWSAVVYVRSRDTVPVAEGRSLVGKIQNLLLGFPVLTVQDETAEECSRG